MVIPKEVQLVIQKLRSSGFEAFIVGGCVRDLMRGVEPEDWDVATNAKPEEIRKIFPQSFYENKFLTVTIQTGSANQKLKEIEITTYRSEAKYTDKRHPDQISFAETIEEDLARRDFTVNAMALEIQKSKRNKFLVPTLSRTLDGIGASESKNQNQTSRFAPCNSAFSGIKDNSKCKII